MVTGNILFPLFDEISRKDMKIDDNMPFVVNKRAPENYYRTRPYIKTRPHRGSRVPCLTPNVYTRFHHINLMLSLKMVT